MHLASHHILPPNPPRITAPQRPQLLLAADVPHQKLYALRFAAGAAHFLAIEANRRHRIQILIELQPVQSGRFARRVQAQHDNVQCALRRWQRVEYVAAVFAHCGAHGDCGSGEKSARIRTQQTQRHGTIIGSIWSQPSQSASPVSQRSGFDCNNAEIDEKIGN